MIEPGERSGSVGRDAGDAVVRPLARAARRPCARPGCPAPAGASLVFSYATREVWLDRLGEDTPQAYDLCSPHAGRTRPPHGWQLQDRRPLDEREADEDAGARSVPSLGGDETVAVLAAALRAVPDLPVSPEEPVTVTEDPSPVLGHRAAPTSSTDDEGAGADDRGEPARTPAPKPILAARPREAPAPGTRTPAADW